MCFECNDIALTETLRSAYTDPADSSSLYNIHTIEDESSLFTISHLISLSAFPILDEGLAFYRNPAIVLISLRWRELEVSGTEAVASLGHFRHGLL